MVPLLRVRGTSRDSVTRHLAHEPLGWRPTALLWNTANDAVLAEGKPVLINDPGRLDGVTAIGVDEDVWRHTRRGDKYVPVIINLSGIRHGTAPARLLDMVEGAPCRRSRPGSPSAQSPGATASRGSGWTVRRFQDRDHRGAA